MQHIVVLTCPAQGHINPLVSLVKLLIPHGFTFTIAVAENLAPKLNHELQSEAEIDSFPASSSITVAPLAFTKKPPSPGPGFSIGAVFEFLNSTAPSFEILLRDLLNSGTVSCIVADCFNTWSHQVAARFKIPIFGFFTANSHVFSAFLHCKAIGDRLASDPDLDQIIDFIPGVEPLPAKALPQTILEDLPFAMSITKDIGLDLGIIFNTVHEMESKSLEVIKTKVPVYSVGPLMLMENFTCPNTENQNGACGIEKQNGFIVPSSEEECIKWLDNKPESSVIFVCFGSMAMFSNDQMRELAIGLENSKQAFLWVIRADVATDDAALSKILPEGFTDRTKERGLIIKWAPQLQVLAHQAIGGFITHCGWNSITENLSLGAVPMICWPLMAEQKLNARILVDEWKVALDLKKDGNGIVKAGTIEKNVIDIFAGNVGKNLKARALELKEILCSAIQKEGSSHNYFHALVEDLKKLSTNN